MGERTERLEPVDSRTLLQRGDERAAPLEPARRTIDDERSHFGYACALRGASSAHPTIRPRRVARPRSVTRVPRLAQLPRQQVAFFLVPADEHVERSRISSSCGTIVHVGDDARLRSPAEGRG